MTGFSDEIVPELPWQPLGRHSFCRAADTCYLRTCGELNATEMKDLLDGLLASTREWGAGLVLIDARSGLGVNTEARQAYAAWSRRHGFQPGSVALFGANSAAWAVIRLITNAINLLTRRELPVRFFRYRRDAMAWLISERLRWRVGDHAR